MREWYSRDETGTVGRLPPSMRNKRVGPNGDRQRETDIYRDRERERGGAGEEREKERERYRGGGEGEGEGREGETHRQTESIFSCYSRLCLHRGDVPTRTRSVAFLRRGPRVAFMPRGPRVALHQPKHNSSSQVIYSTMFVTHVVY